MRQPLRTLLLSFLAPAVAACAGRGVPPSLTAVPPGGRGPATSLMLVADNQLNRIFDYDATGEGLGEAFTGVSVRPTALDLFGQELLAAALAEHQGPVVHLGDAADIACVDEFERFLEIMSESGRLWAFTPGNHDFTYRGNFHDTRPDGEWTRACRGPGADPDRPSLLTKDRTVRMYLDAQSGCRGGCAAPGLDAAADAGSRASTTEGSFLRGSHGPSTGGSRGAPTWSRRYGCRVPTWTPA